MFEDFWNWFTGDGKIGLGWLGSNWFSYAPDVASATNTPYNYSTGQIDGSITDPDDSDLSADGSGGVDGMSWQQEAVIGSVIIIAVLILLLLLLGKIEAL